MQVSLALKDASTLPDPWGRGRKGKPEITHPPAMWGVAARWEPRGHSLSPCVQPTGPQLASPGLGEVCSTSFVDGCWILVHFTKQQQGDSLWLWDLPLPVPDQ